MLDPQVINAAFSGLVLLLGAVGGLVTVRGRRAAVGRREHRRLQARFLVALGHIFTLKTAMAAHGLDIPPDPPELADDDEDDPAPTPGGRRG